MRRAVPCLLLATACLAFLSACASGNPTVGGTNPQVGYVQQISLERQGLGTGQMIVDMPTSGTQGGSDTLTVKISGSASGQPTITMTSGGSASPTTTVVATSVAVGGMMDVHTTCTGLTCTPVSNEPQPVAAGLTGTWTWNLGYGQEGTGYVQIVADLYQTSSTNVLWQSAPLTRTISIEATQQQKVDRSLNWLHDTIISVAAVVVALAPIATWLWRWRAKRKKATAQSPVEKKSSKDQPKA